MESITKSELIDKVSRQFSDYKKKDIERAVNVIFDSMKLALINDQRIEIRGLGTFKVKDRPARQGRNPKSGEGVSIPDRKIPFFKAGRALKLKLNID
jgi:integration host factor subunit beta